MSKSSTRTARQVTIKVSCTGERQISESGQVSVVMLVILRACSKWRGQMLAGMVTVVVRVTLMVGDTVVGLLPALREV